MIDKYQQDYRLYFDDQMTRFESFEGQLYKKGIQDTINHIFPAETYTGSRVLDFCCGDGTTSGILSREKGFFVIGCDGNERKINAAMMNETDNMDVNFLCCDAKDFSCRFKNLMKFHFIYASHCFEHFLDPVGLLKEIREFLVPGGNLILILPLPSEESDGHPGAGILKLNRPFGEVIDNLTDHGFNVRHYELANFREPEIIITLN